MSASAIKGTGPRTEAGKAVSRFNPLRHGLTSQHLVLPGENPEDFAKLLEDLRAQWTPEHPDEDALVAKIAEGEWRMIRSRRVETATLKLYMERILAEDPSAETPDYDRILALVYDRYGKELDRLRRYETTISRALAKTYRELRDLIQGRAELDAQTRTDDEQDVIPEAELPELEASIFACREFVSQFTSESGQSAVPVSAVQKSAPHTLASNRD